MKTLILICLIAAYLVGCGTAKIKWEFINKSKCEDRGTWDGEQISHCPRFEVK